MHQIAAGLADGFDNRLEPLSLRFGVHFKQYRSIITPEAMIPMMKIGHMKKPPLRSKPMAPERRMCTSSSEDFADACSVIIAPGLALSGGGVLSGRIFRGHSGRCRFGRFRFRDRLAGQARSRVIAIIFSIGGVLDSD